MKRKILLINFIIIGFLTARSEGEDLWKDLANPQAESIIKVENPRYLQLDIDAMKNLLDQAPWEDFNTHATGQFAVSVPLPDGSFEKFFIERTHLMQAGLAAKYPGIKTFSGHSSTSNLRRITLDYTYSGLHALISYPGESIFIDPINKQTDKDYISYYKSDFYRTNTSNFEEWDVVYPDKGEISLPTNNSLASRPIGGELVTYRLALATTGEYSNYFGNTPNQVMSAVQTSIARVNDVYEVDLGVRLVLINNTDTLFNYTTNDGYTNTSGGSMLGQNQSIIDAKIGTANYDMGHVFSTGGGGVASYASVCSSTRKAQGVTGSFAPVGDPFDIDYVAHEMGHQFSGSHTFDGISGSCSGGNRNSSTAYEPGSGTTIMAYAGICNGDNLQSHSDPFFHVGSYVEMTNFIYNGGGSCGVTTTTTNNAPTVDANPTNDDFVIPMETAFELTGSGTDPDGDNLSFIWEEYDRTSQGSYAVQPSASSPLFRSWTPQEDGYHRYFPRMYNILNNNSVKGETYPFSERVMKFRLTARDYLPGGGGVEWDETSISINDQAGPFLVLYPDSNGHFLEAGDWNHIQWDVSETDKFPILTSHVDFYLSINTGNTFDKDVILATNVENDGSHYLFVPDSLAGSSNCRLMIHSVNNIFFDISNNKFNIVAYDGTPNPSMGVNDNLIGEVSIHPNPTTGFVNIQSNINIDKIELINLIGENLISDNNTKGRLDISNFDRGIYFVKIHLANGEIATERITKY